jgi:hypothetical protein
MWRIAVWGSLYLGISVLRAALRSERSKMGEEAGGPRPAARAVGGAVPNRASTAGAPHFAPPAS